MRVPPQVFFKMRVAGVLHIFQFETRQGEDICMALQTHINDIMMKRYSKVESGSALAQPCRDGIMMKRLLQRTASQRTASH